LKFAFGSARLFRERNSNWGVSETMRSRPPLVSALLCVSLLSASSRFPSTTFAHPRKSSVVNVRLVTDEAEAVLRILAKKRANLPISSEDWQQVFSSEGYVRLKKRETSMKRSFADDDFKAFVLGDQLSVRAQQLETTLARWKLADLTRATRLALAYLPKEARINAKIYPVIKPRENSFVFDLDSDPAIFLYLDPTVDKPKFENTLAHELHHIGFGTTCPSKQTSSALDKLSANERTAVRLLGAFGEGFAMLAAAGGPRIHPHAVSDAKERSRWDESMANVNDDLRKVEKFFLDLLAERLTEKQIQETASSFYGIQGPWYTIGWKMAVTIEKEFGRRKMIESFCDQRKLLSTYNQAAARYNRRARQPLPLWSDELVKKLGKGE
jgi:hypothetical protein